MPWFRVDDQLHAHPKPNKAGLAAMGLWTLAGSHCMSYLTDGVVERWWVESKPRGVKLAARLVAAGLWHEHPDGWVFHDWEEFQPTREQILAERGAAVEPNRQLPADAEILAAPARLVDGAQDVPFVMRAEAEGDGGAQRVVDAETALVDPVVGDEFLQARVGLEKVLEIIVELLHVVDAVEPEMAREVARADEIVEIESSPKPLLPSITCVHISM